MAMWPVTKLLWAILLSLYIVMDLHGLAGVSALVSFHPKHCEGQTLLLLLLLLLLLCMNII